MSDPILIDIPSELIGDRIIVRPWRAGDGNALFEGIDQSREHLGRWMPWAELKDSPEDREIYVRKSVARWILREDLGLGIWNKQSGRLIGATGLHRIDWITRKFEIGYWIRVDEEGKGYVTEAAALVTKLAFETLEASRVFIRCAETNHRSAAIPKRLGYEFEGMAKNDIRSPDGKLHNTLVFGMTPEMYAKQPIL